MNTHISYAAKNTLQHTVREREKSCSWDRVRCGSFDHCGDFPSLKQGCVPRVGIEQKVPVCRRRRSHAKDNAAIDVGKGIVVQSQLDYFDVQQLGLYRVGNADLKGQRFAFCFFGSMTQSTGPLTLSILLPNRKYRLFSAWRVQGIDVRHNAHFFGPTLRAPSCRMALCCVLGRSMVVGMSAQLLGAFFLVPGVFLSSFLRARACWMRLLMTLTAVRAVLLSRTFFWEKSDLPRDGVAAAR